MNYQEEAKEEELSYPEWGNGEEARDFVSHAFTGPKFRGHPRLYEIILRCMYADDMIWSGDMYGQSSDNSGTLFRSRGLVYAFHSCQ